MSDRLPTTIGFECEFDSGADDVIRWLYGTGDGLVGAPRLHRYHCDDSTCTDYLLHGQTDSSCSGEIISNIISDWDVMVRLTEAIETAAVQVDAVPGMSAGFHVHIGRPERESALRRNAFFEAIRYEQVLQFLARGRFELQRHNNHTLSEALHPHIYRLNGSPWYNGVTDAWYTDTNYHQPRAIEWIRHQSHQTEIKERLYAGHRENDRHSNLAIRTRFSTWEFRFWNSTRSAWRMQMFVGLSAAFANAQFVTNLMNTDGIPSDHPSTAIDNIIEALSYAEMNTTAELVTRQKDFMDRMDRGVLLVPYEFTTA